MMVIILVVLVVALGIATKSPQRGTSADLQCKARPRFFLSEVTPKTPLEYVSDVAF